MVNLFKNREPKSVFRKKKNKHYASSKTIGSLPYSEYKSNIARNYTKCQQRFPNVVPNIIIQFR